MARTTTKKTATRKKSSVKVERTAEVQEAIDRGERSPRGRQAGSRNKIPLEVRKVLADFLGNEIPYLMTRQDELELKDRWDIVGKVLPYVTPKMISNDINGNIEVDSVGNQLSSLASESITKMIGS